VTTDDMAPVENAGVAQKKKNGGRKEREGKPHISIARGASSCVTGKRCRTRRGKELEAVDAFEHL